MESKRQQKFAGVIQQDLAAIFQREGMNLLPNTMITITKVRVTPDLAIARVAERVRQLSGLSGDGAALVNKASAGLQPALALGPLTTDSEKSEQKGFANLLIGLFGAVRNPLAHAPKTNWPMSEQDALDILTLVSLIHRKLDGTQKTTVTAP